MGVIVTSKVEYLGGCWRLIQKYPQYHDKRDTQIKNGKYVCTIALQVTKEPLKNIQMPIVSMP